MSAEVAEAIRQTRRTLADKTWVPDIPNEDRGEVCAVTAVPGGFTEDLTWSVWAAFGEQLGWFPDEPEGVFDVLTYPDDVVGDWNDWQVDVGAVLGMTLQALIAELCKPTLAPRTTEA